MKTLHNLASLFVASALVSIAGAAEPVKVVGEYLPAGGTLASGAIVNVQFDKELPEYLKKFDDAAAKLPEAEQLELRKTLKPGQPIPFDSRFGMSKEDYDKYLEVWNRKKIVDVAPVVAGFVASGEPGIWKVASSTQSGPMPFSTLKYDENKGVWTSPNGVLERKADVDYNESNNLGAWKGQEWLYENKSSFSHTAENVLMGKTADGKYVFVIYNYLEVTTQGSVVDNKTVVLRFPVSAIKGTGAGDSLIDKAKKDANSGHNL